MFSIVWEFGVLFVRHGLMGRPEWRAGLCEPASKVWHIRQRLTSGNSGAAIGAVWLTGGLRPGRKPAGSPELSSCQGCAFRSRSSRRRKTSPKRYRTTSEGYSWKGGLAEADALSTCLSFYGAKAEGVNATGAEGEGNTALMS